MNKIYRHIALIVFISATMFSCGSQKHQKTEKDSVVAEADTIKTSQPDTIDVSANDKSILQTTDDFTVVYATSQKWHGGVKGSGGGVNYEVCLLALNSSSQLIIDQLWVGQVFHETSASRKFPKTSADGFVNGDTVYLYAHDYTKSADDIKKIDDENGKTVTEEVKQNIPPPFAYAGEALIGYNLNGTRKYKEISKIKVKPPLFYP